jgi:hypothetical protein
VVTGTILNCPCREERQLSRVEASRTHRDTNERQQRKFLGEKPREIQLELNYVCPTTAISYYYYYEGGGGSSSMILSPPPASPAASTISNDALNESRHQVSFFFPDPVLSCVRERLNS